MNTVKYCKVPLTYLPAIELKDTNPDTKAGAGNQGLLIVGILSSNNLNINSAKNVEG